MTFLAELPPNAARLFAVLGLVLVLAFGVGGYILFAKSQGLRHAQSDLASSTRAYDARVIELTHALDTATAENEALSASLTDERHKNESFGNQLNDLSSTVGVLTKLASTDPQLLAKYSKVYFLNENYAPKSLTRIDPAETYDTSRSYTFDSRALPFLDSLIQDARASGIELRVVSSYRSFADQSALKTSYKVVYGTGANRFSADQGYSEHQLGTTVDFTTTALGANFSSFEGTDAYAWLSSNAYRYGFILSYPKANTYYTFEPWHWRFVGIRLAADLHDKGQYFYGLDQRTINTYLANLYDR